jgi:para-nitrobenzyl esterase
MRLLLLTACSLALSCLVTGAPAPLTLTTPQGSVTGSYDTDSTDVRVFRGIPFGQAPVGDRRWRAPMPYGNFQTEPYDATQYKPICAQPVPDPPLYYVGSEDCLYLNVFAPANPTNASLPVYVYIYGGGFLVGSASANPGSNFVRGNQGLLVVTINYRLGVWGFLAHPAFSQERGLGNVATSGNFGLEDQVLALKWVQANIAAYGGDPQRVTIGGESAGAISVCYHIVSPLSAGLFQRAISESGGCDANPQSVRTSETNGLGYAKSVATFTVGALECATSGGLSTNLTKAADCLRSVDATSLIIAANFYGSFNFFGPTGLVPSVDGYFLPDWPQNILSAGQQNKVDLLIGSNAAEMGLFIKPVASGSASFPEPTPEVLAATAAQTARGSQGIIDYYSVNSVPARFPTITIATQSLLSKNLFQCPSTRLGQCRNERTESLMKKL